MKNILYIIFLIFLTSCHNEPVDFNNVDDYSIALDTLDGYSDYILGDFNGKFLISTNVFVKGYGATTPNPNDSIPIDYNIGYKVLNEDIFKTVFIEFGYVESRDNLNENFRHNSFNGFLDFFNNEFEYYSTNQIYPLYHYMRLYYQNN